MESKKYTAKQYRTMECVITSGNIRESTRQEIALMLRQAADMMEREEKRERKREKKYEYAVKICFESEEHYALDLYDDLEMAKEFAELPSGNRREILCREVGEWEEVKDGE